jgi:hypothetical protein
MKIKNILYAYLDEAIDNYYADEEFEEEEHVIQDESIGADAIVTFGPAWRILDKNLIIVEGTYCNYNPETNEYDPDWSLTLIYDNVPDKQFDINKYVYYEQDAPMTSIHNYLRAVHPNVKEAAV